MITGLRGEIGRHLEITDKPERLTHLADTHIDSNIREVIRGFDEIVYFSSASVYGPDTPYKQVKLESERILEGSGIPTLVLRLPGVLEITRATSLLSRIMVKLKQDETVTIFNSAKDFNCYLGIPQLNFLDNVEIRGFDIIDLGNNPLSLGVIVGTMRHEVGSKSPVFKEVGNSPVLNMDIEKARDYGFNPGNPFEVITDWCHTQQL